MEAWLQIKGAGAISQDGHEKSGMAKAMITMAEGCAPRSGAAREQRKEELGTVSKRVHVQAGYADGCSCVQKQRTFNKDSGESLQAYFARMYALNDELIACGSKPDDEEVVMLLLETCQGRASTITLQRSPSSHTRHEAAHS
jgi:hypothetical protein